MRNKKIKRPLNNNQTIAQTSKTEQKYGSIISSRPKFTLLVIVWFSAVLNSLVLCLNCFQLWPKCFCEVEILLQKMSCVFNYSSVHDIKIILFFTGLECVINRFRPENFSKTTFVVLVLKTCQFQPKMGIFWGRGQGFH